MRIYLQIYMAVFFITGLLEGVLPGRRRTRARGLRGAGAGHRTDAYHPEALRITSSGKAAG